MEGSTPQALSARAGTRMGTRRIESQGRRIGTNKARL
jgi:hypothetical protein